MERWRMVVGDRAYKATRYKTLCLSAVLYFFRYLRVQSCAFSLQFSSGWLIV